MILKENYFGGFNSWTNMAEFRKKYEATIPSWGDAVEQKYRPGRVRVTVHITLHLSLIL